MPFILPKLKFDYTALEPYIDARTMEIHYTKHHQAYIDNLNKALVKYDNLKNTTAEKLLADLDSVPEDIKTIVRNNAGGYLNHNFFWEILTPAKTKPSAELMAKIETDLESFDKLTAEFTKAALGRFGSGWAWVVYDGQKMTITSTANQDSPLLEGLKPILGLDVWEHAYYLNYQNRRADYIDAFWHVVDWEQVESNLAS